MAPRSGHSRRALVAGAAALAAAPVTQARKKNKKNTRKGKGKGKPPALLVLATVVVTRLHELSIDAFTFLIEIGYVHPASGEMKGNATSADLAPTATRDGIIAAVQEWVAFDLGRSGLNVPDDRIDVTIL
jgi:hypothetical protein